MGDPAGIGPEVIVAAWSDELVHSQARLVVIGHPEILRRAARLLNRDIDVVAPARVEYDALRVTLAVADAQEEAEWK